MTRTGLLGMLGAAVLVVGCNSPARDTTDTTRNDGASRSDGVGTSGEDRTVSAGVRGFVENASHANNAEIQLGQMASTRGQDADVKAYGQMMVSEHSNASNELRQAVSGFDVQVPTDIDDKHRDLAERLGKLSGAEFDREYIDAMVDGHEAVRDMLDGRADDAPGEAGKVEDAVNKWAKQTLPAVEKHLDRAKQIQQQLKGRNTTAAR